MIHFYSLLLPLATIQSHQTRCGGISKSKELLLEQDVSCSIDVVYPMHTTKQSTTVIRRKAVQHHKKKATSKIDVAFMKSGDFKCQSNTVNYPRAKARGLQVQAHLH